MTSKSPKQNPSHSLILQSTIHMWNHIPFDLLTNIFFFLPPDSLARVTSTCKHWHTCVQSCLSQTASSNTGHQPPWFLAMHVHNRRLLCFTHNPNLNRWHLLPLDFFPDPIRLIAPIGNLLLCKPVTTPFLHLALCNPFTRQYRSLPPLLTPRSNPAVGVVVPKEGHKASFQVYIAGGLSEAPRGGASYEPTLEIYDSRIDKWQNLGVMPAEFAVRLTVWTPKESVYSEGVLYWMTSARAYSVMGLEVGNHVWREVKVPMGGQLECAALVPRAGQLALFGGTCGGEACIWELSVGDVWVLVEKVPVEMGSKLLGSKGSWCSTKCVGSDEALYLFGDLGSDMLVWREGSLKGRWEWLWVEGCCALKGQRPHFSIKGVVFHPTIDPSCMLGT